MNTHPTTSNLRILAASTSIEPHVFIARQLQRARRAMEEALWYLITGTRGGKNRARIIRCLLDHPQNPNQIAERLNLDYNTVRHHLDILTDHDVIGASGEEYGAVYFVTDRFERHIDTFEEITEHLN